MQDQANNSLVDPMGDCSQCLLNLIVFGMATPYLHNGVMEIEDEDKCEVSFKVIFGIKKKDKNNIKNHLKFSLCKSIYNIFHQVHLN